MASLRVGRHLLLKSDHFGAYISSSGFGEDDTCVPASFRDSGAGEVATLANEDERVFQLVSCADTVPRQLFNGGAAGSGEARARGSTVDLDLQHAARVPRLLARLIEDRAAESGGELPAKLELADMVSAAMRKDGRVLALAVAFEPDLYPGSDIFAAMVSREATDPNDLTVRFLNESNYVPLHVHRAWYRTPKARGSAVWTEPRLDEAGSNVPVISYSVPVRRRDQSGTFVGVVRMDVRLGTEVSGAVSAPAGAASGAAAAAAARGRRRRGAHPAGQHLAEAVAAAKSAVLQPTLAEVKDEVARKVALLSRKVAAAAAGGRLRVANLERWIQSDVLAHERVYSGGLAVHDGSRVLASDGAAPATAAGCHLSVVGSRDRFTGEVEWEHQAEEEDGRGGAGSGAFHALGAAAASTASKMRHRLSASVGPRISLLRRTSTAESDTSDADAEAEAEAEAEADAAAAEPPLFVRPWYDAVVSGRGVRGCAATDGAGDNSGGEDSDGGGSGEGPDRFGGVWCERRRNADGHTVLAYAVPMRLDGGAPAPGTASDGVLVAEILCEAAPGSAAAPPVVCSSCGLQTPECYYENEVSLTRSVVCPRCFFDGVLPHDSRVSDFRREATLAYDEWLDRYRRPHEIVFGMHVQLVHSRSGRFLSVQLGGGAQQQQRHADGSRLNFYSVELEGTCQADPYLEGGESTWFTVMPASESRSLGERVAENDQVRLVSTRWKWELSFPRLSGGGGGGGGGGSGSADANRRESAAAARNQHSDKWCLSQVTSWKLVPHSVPDLYLDMGARLRRADNPHAVAAAAFHRSRYAARRIVALEPPSARSPYLRHGDVIRLRSSTSDDCMAVLSRFYEKGELSEERLALCGANVCRAPGGNAVLHAHLHPCDRVRMASLWRVELPDDTVDKAGVDDRAADRVVRWGDSVRLRHVLTNRLLCVPLSAADRPSGVIAHDGDVAAVGTSFFSTVMADEGRVAAWGQRGCSDAWSLHPSSGRGSSSDEAPVEAGRPFFLRVRLGKRQVRALAAGGAAGGNDSGSKRSSSNGGGADDDGNDDGNDDDDDDDDESGGRGQSYWLNVASFGIAVTPYRDEEDTLVVAKAATREIQAAFTAVAATDKLDATLGMLCDGYRRPAGPLPDEAACVPGHAPWEAWRAAAESFGARAAPRLEAAARALERLCRFVIVGCNNASVLTADMLSHPAHDQAGRTGICLHWRQSLLVAQHVVERTFALLSHDFVDDALLAVRADLAAGGRLARHAVTPARRAVMSVFRAALKLVSLLVIDNAPAAHLAGTGRRGANLLLLFGKMADSARHRLGVQRLLALMFENGRESNGLLTMNRSQMDLMVEAWVGLVRERQELEADVYRELRACAAEGRPADRMRMRAFAERNVERQRASLSFLRVLSSLTTFGNAADVVNQRELLESLVEAGRCMPDYVPPTVSAAEARALVDRRKSLPAAQMAAMARAVAEAAAEAVPSEPEAAAAATGPGERPWQLADLTPAVLKLVASFCKDACLTDAHGIWDRARYLERAMGMPLGSLRLDFDSLLDVMSNEGGGATLETRARSCDILHELYVRSRHTRRVIELVRPHPAVATAAARRAPLAYAASPRGGPARLERHATAQTGSPLQPIERPPVLASLSLPVAAEDGAGPPSPLSPLLSPVSGCPAPRGRTLPSLSPLRSRTVEDGDGNNNDDEKQQEEEEEEEERLASGPGTQPRRWKPLTEEQASLVWGFALEYLGQCATTHDENLLTLHVLSLLETLLVARVRPGRRVAAPNDGSTGGLHGGGPPLVNGLADSEPHAAGRAPSPERRLADSLTPAVTGEVGPSSQLSLLAQYMVPLLNSRPIGDKDAAADPIAWERIIRRFRDIKLTVLRLLSTLSDYRLNSRLNAFLRTATSAAASSADAAAAAAVLGPVSPKAEVDHGAAAPGKRLLSLDTGDSASTPRSRSRCEMTGPRLASSLECSMERAQEVLSDPTSYVLPPDVPLYKDLLSIARSWEDSALVTSAFALLQRQNKQASELQVALKRCVFVPSVEEMVRCRQASDTLQALAHTLRSELKATSAATLDLGATAGKLDEVLRHLAAVEAYMRPGGEGAAPARHRQHAVRALDGHKLLASVLSIPVPPGAPAGSPVRRIVSATYRALTAFAAGNGKNCKKLERHMGRFFEHAPLGVGSTLLLAEVVRDNYELCSRVEPARVSAYQDFLASSSEPWTKSAAPVALMRALVCVHGRLIPHTQSLVVKGACENSSVLGLLAAVGGQCEREALAGLLDGPDQRNEDLVVRPRGAPMFGSTAEEDEAEGEQGGEGGDRRRHRPVSPPPAPGAVPSRIIAEAREWHRPEYYTEMLRLLTLCAPARYSYTSDRAKRESEESALLCRAALPLEPMVRLACELRHISAVSPVLRFVERVHGVGELMRRPELVEMLLARFEDATGAVSRTPMRASRAQLEFVVGDVSRVLVVLFHSGFTLERATTGLVASASRVLANLVRLAEAALGIAWRRAEGVHRPQPDLAAAADRIRSVPAKDDGERTGTAADALVNAIMHMYDPTGTSRARPKGVLGRLSRARLASVVRGLGQASDRASCVAPAPDSPAPAPRPPAAAGSSSAAAVRVSTHFFKDDAGFHSSRGAVPDRARSSSFGGGGGATPLTPRGRMVRQEMRALAAEEDDSGLDKSALQRVFLTSTAAESRRFDVMFVGAQSLSLIRKAILLIGEFGRGEGREGTHASSSGNAWVDDNSSKFAVTYLRVLQRAVDPDTVEADDGNLELAALGAAGGTDKRASPEAAAGPPPVPRFSPAERQALKHMMVELGLCGKIVDLVARTESTKITQAALSLANSLLDGGFAPAQDAFQEHLEEVGSTGVFARLRDILCTQLRLTSKVSMRAAASASGMSLVAAEDHKWTPRRYGSWTLVRMTLRFLQLLCEGHNLAWQQLLNRQGLGTTVPGAAGDAGAAAGGSSGGAAYDDDGDDSAAAAAAKDMLAAAASARGFNAHAPSDPAGGDEGGGAQAAGVSVNLVTRTLDLLARMVCEHGPVWYMLVYYNAWYDDDVLEVAMGVVDQALETLIEAMQGPCAVNQVEVARGRFVESFNWLVDAVDTAQSSREEHERRVAEDARRAASGGLEGDMDGDGDVDREDDLLREENQKALARYGEWAVPVDGEKVDRREHRYLALQETLVTALNAMLEGVKDPQVPVRIIATMNFSAVGGVIKRYLAYSRDPERVLAAAKAARVLGELDGGGEPDPMTASCEWPPLPEGDNNPYARVCAGYYIFLRSLMDAYDRAGVQGAVSGKFRALLTSDVFAELESRYVNRVGSVEILRGGEVEVCFFKIPEVVETMSRTPSFMAAKSRLMLEVRRENQYAKLDDFLRSNDDLVYDLTANPHIQRSFVVRHFFGILNASFYCALLLNLLTIVTDDGIGADDTSTHGGRTELALHALGMVQVVLSFFRLVSVVASHGPLAYFRHCEAMAEAEAERERQQQPSGTFLGGSDGGAGGGGGGGGGVGGGGAFGAALAGGATALKDSAKFVERQARRTAALVWFVAGFALSPMPLFQILYVAAAFLGLVYPVAYAFMLLDYVGRSKELKQVFSALAAYAGSLLATGVLWVILLYAYAAVGFAFFSDQFYGSTVSGGEEVNDDALCGSKMECISFIVTKGLRAGGGIADEIQDVDYDDDMFWWRALYDDSYFVIMVLILVSVVTGIIIDGFGASRDDLSAVREDQRGQCFICGVARSEFESRRGFSWHTTKEHGQWQYTFLLAHLRLKDPTTYNGQESYVAGKVADGDISWFPIGRALMLESDDGGKK